MASNAPQEDTDQLRSRVDQMLRNLVNGTELDTQSLQTQVNSLRGSGPNTLGANGVTATDDAMAIDSSIPTVKVTNQWIVDPYGDKGQYDGDVMHVEDGDNNTRVKDNTGNPAVNSMNDDNGAVNTTTVTSNAPSALPHGFGIMRYTDGRTYEGQWNKSQWHGQGRATFSNGDVFEGTYVNDQRHGDGVYQWMDGRCYRGSFQNDQRSGKGQYTWPDGAIYEGDFEGGLRHGWGAYKFRDGSSYTGEWSKGKYHGQGEMRWTDGRVYRGAWHEGKAHGYGVETRPNGTTRHDGQWRDDKPLRGEGTSTSNNTNNDNNNNSNEMPTSL